MPDSSPSTQADLVRDTFEARATEYASWYEGATFSAQAFRRRRELALEVIEALPAGRVLDIGCGPAVMVGEMLAMGHEVWGVDVAPAMIDQCRARFAGDPRAHFEVGQIEQMALADGSFDAVTCLGVVEYLDEDLAAIREMHRVLKPGGIAIITCPHHGAPWRRWEAIYWSIVEPIRRVLGRAPYDLIVHREYRERDYRALLEDAGFRVVDVAYYGFGLVPFPLDKRFPRLHAKLDRALQDQARGPLRKLGMGFNVTVRKR